MACVGTEPSSNKPFVKMPPKARITGSKGPLFQGNDFRFNPRRGFELAYEYRGTFAAMSTLAFQLAAARVAYRFKQQGQLASITLEGNTAVEAGYTEVPQDSW